VITPRVLLCDADGTLFPSEEPAFEASVRVTNRMLAELGGDRRYQAEQLRQATNGRNFRSTAPLLAVESGLRLEGEALERWVAVEKREVTAHLARALRPDRRVSEPLRRLAQRHELAVVSSSASARVAACLEATGLANLFDDERLFSAEDSLEQPRSKPAPDVYLHAREVLGVEGAEALAVEDAVPGVESAVAAGVPVIGCVMFVPVGERAEREEALRGAGALAVVASWGEIDRMLSAAPDLAGRA
jgi:HAD superfamily hydrolase (TIGR01509 family)